MADDALHALYIPCEADSFWTGYLTPELWGAESITSYEARKLPEATGDIETWYLALDIPTAAPEIAPIAMPLITRINELMNGVHVCWQIIRGPKGDDFDDPYWLGPGGTPPVGESIILPSFEGFSDSQRAILQHHIEWLRDHHPKVLPRHETIITLRPEASTAAGEVDIWSGNVYIEESAFKRADADIELMRILAHELMHAIPNRASRIYSLIRADGLQPKVLFGGALKDESEHQFIEDFGVAVRDEYNGDHAAVVKKIVYDGDGIPTLERSGITQRLPIWSPLVGCFTIPIWVGP